MERRRAQSQGMRPWSGMENLEPRLLMAAAPLTVSFTLADQHTNQALSTLNLTTSEPVVGNTLDGAGSTSVYSLLNLGFDQTIGGGDDTSVPILTANYDGNTSISLGLSGDLADGKYRLMVQSGNPGLRSSVDGTPLDGDSDGSGGGDYAALFTVDRIAPQVSSMVPSVTSGVTSDVLVQFTEEMNPAGVNASNITIDTPGGPTPVTGIVYEGSNIFRIQFAPQGSQGDYHVNIHDVTDLAGNKLAVEQPGSVVYQNDFENPAAVGAEWSSPITLDEDVTTRYLGMFQNNDVTLSLNSLPAHSAIQVEFDLYLRDTWDGIELGDGDKFGFGVDGMGTADSYSNFEFLPQTFPGSPDVGRFNFFGDPLANDSIYRRMTGTFAHSNSAAELFFFGENLNDENWGIDNLKVTLIPDPAVQPEATFTGTFTIDTQPPVVDSVVWGSNYIRVKFSDDTDIDKLAAENFSNYELRASGGDRFFDDGFAIAGTSFYYDGYTGFAPDQFVGPWDIDYQSQTRTATLYFLNPLADEAYELRVFGDVMDLAGNGLSGGAFIAGHLVDNDNPPQVDVAMESMDDTGEQGDMRTQNRSPFFNVTADQAGYFDVQVTRLGFDNPFNWYSDTFILTEADGVISFRLGDPGNIGEGGGASSGEATGLDFFTLDDGRYQVFINYYGTNSDSDYTQKVFEFAIDNQPPSLIPAQSGVAGKALEFDGIDGFDPAVGGDVAAIPTDNYSNGWNQIYNNQQITIESWVRVDSYPQGWFSVADYGQWLLQLSSTGDLQFIVGGNAFTPGQPVNLPLGEWHHVAVTYNTYQYSINYGYYSQAKFYIDGVQVGETAETPYTAYLNYSGQPLYLGYNPYGGEEYSHGALDELRIWGKVRTQAEILADLNASMPADASGLVGLWHFDEAPGSTAILDSSGNNNHGTISDGRQIAGRSLVGDRNFLQGAADHWTLTFNEILDAASVQPADFQLFNPSMTDISAMIQSVEVHGSFVTLHFSSPLPAPGQYTVVVNGPLADASGNQTSPAAADHFSIFDGDGQSPIVVDLEPQGQTTPVGSIFIEFGEDVDITVGDITLLMPDASPYAGAITLTQVPGRGRYRLNLDGPLTVAGTYTITIAGSVADSSGNELDGNGDGVGGDSHTATFTIDNSPPALVTGFFSDSSTIQVIFSETGSGIDPSTFSNLYAAFTLTGSGGDGILGGGLADDQTLFIFSGHDWDAGSNTLTIYLSNNLPDDAYSLSINPVIRDFAGNAIAPSGFGTSFDFVDANDLFLGLDSESDSGFLSDDGLTNDTNPTLLVRPPFNAGRIRVDTDGDGNEDVSTFVSFGNAGGNFLFNLPAAMPDGEHHFTVTFEAADTGQIVVQSYYYTIDTQPPVLDPGVMTDVQSLTLTISDNSDLFDVGSIVNAGNYALLASGGDGIFGNGNDQNLTGTITSVDFDDVTGEIVIHTSVPILEDRIQLTVSGNLSDAAGNRLNSGDDTVLEFDNLNASPIIYPNLTGKLPIGSLIYDPFVNSTFFGDGDVDDFTVSVDPGQKLTVGLVPLVGGIQASLELFDGSMNSMGFVSAASPGQSVILQNLPTTGSTQTYTLRAASITGGGAYELHVVLNAMVDSEEIGPFDNGSIAQAEDLQATALALTGSADRLGAIGSLQGADVDFYKFTAQAGQFNDIALTSQGNQVVSLAVFNSAGTLVALGSPRENISGFIQGLISSADQTLYIRVTGDPNTDYTLVVTRNASLDAEPNTALDTPQSIGGPMVALGGLGFADKFTDFTDDNGDASLEGWTINGGLWHVTSAVGGTLLGDQHSAPHIAYYGLDATGNFNAGTTSGNLISPIVALPASGTPTLEFKYRLAGEGGNPYDRASVMISVDGGGFSEIATNANGTIPHGTASWLFKSINLSAFAGHNVQFMFRFNTVDSIANSSLGWQVDDIHVTGPDADYYFFNASEGANLQITTQTPGDGPGQPLNELNPMIELFAPGGASVASDQNSAADGRNAVINYAVPLGAAGVYTVVVRGESGVGDYILKIDGADATIGPAPSVVSTAPVNGAVIGSLSSFIDVAFTEAIRGDSLDLSDLQITSGTATVTGVSLTKSDTVRFTLSGPPGDQIVNYSIAAGAILDLQNQGNAAYSGNLIIDNIGARVVSTSPTSVNSAFDHIDVSFSEPIQGATLTNANIVLRDPTENVISIASAVNVSGNTWRLNFATQNAIGVYSLKIGPGVLDTIGNPMDQDQDGVNNEAVEDVFSVSIVLGDQVPLQVVGVAPQLTNGNVSAISVTFNDVVNQSTFDLGDVSITAQSPAPTSWYQFEEGSGTSFFDQQEGASDGTHNAGYSTDVPLASVGGHANTRSLSFNGSQSAVSTEDFLLHSAVDATMEFFIKAPDQPHHSVFWTRGDGADTNRFNIGLNPGGSMFADYRAPDGSLHSLGSFNIGVDVWSHVAIVRNVDSAHTHSYKFFVNGQQVGAAVDVNPNLPTAGGWSIAGRPGFEFNGLLDEIRLTDKALIPSQFLPNVPAVPPAPTSFSWDASGKVLTLNFASPISAEGKYKLSIGPNIQDDEGNSLSPGFTSFPAASASNLIQNGGFDAYDAGGSYESYTTAPAGFVWTIGNNNVDIINSLWLGSSGSVNPDGFDQSVDIDNNAFIEQSFATTPGQAYRLQFDYAHNPFGIGSIGSVKVTGATTLLSQPLDHRFISDQNVMDYTPFQAVFIADSLSTTLRFQGDFANGFAGFVVDNVRVQSVLAPDATPFMADLIIDTTAPVASINTFTGSQYFVFLGDNVGMDVATVQNTANYTLFNSGGDGIFGNGDDIDFTSQINRVQWDPSTGLAHVIYNVFMPDDIYRFTINGAVRDLAGNTLAGGDFVFTHAVNNNGAYTVIDLDAPSDTGINNADNITADNTPTFSIYANEAGTLEVDLDGDTIFETSVLINSSIVGYHSFTAPALADGNYTIHSRLTPTSGAAANASLAITIDTHGSSITASVPNGPVDPPVDHINVTFSEAIDPSSFTDADVTLLSPSSAPITIDSIVNVGGNSYRLNFAAQTANGTYSLNIGPNIADAAGNPLNQDGDGMNGEAVEDAFSSTFTIADLTPPQVQSITPTGPVNTDVSSVVIVFTEKVDVATFDLSDIVFTTPGGIVSPTSLTASDAMVVGGKTGAQTWTLSFANQSVEGDYSVAIGPDILDLAGLQLLVAPQQLIYQNDFEGGAGGEWSSLTLASLTPPDTGVATNILGRYTNDTVTLTLAAVPSHTTLTVMVDLYILDSWDDGGLPGGDRWQYTITGADVNPVFQHTFSNFNVNSDTFPGTPDVGPVHFAFTGWPDAIYRNLQSTINHAGSSVQIAFSGANLQDVSDESWAIDNVRIFAAVDTAGQAFLGKFTIDKTAPTVTNTAISPTEIQVTYADVVGMNVASVVDKSNYTLTASGGDGLFGDGNDIDVSSRIQSILFNPATGVATLALSPSLGDDVYKLTVNGTNSVKDAAGNKISGGDFTSTLTLNAVAASVSIDLQSASDTGQNGGDNITRNTNLDFTVNFNESGLLELDFDGDSVFESSQVVSGSGSLIFNRTLSEGTTTVHARLTPTVGAAANASLPVTVDALSPSATATAPADATSTFGSVTFVDVVFSEDIDFGTILIAGGVTITGPSSVIAPTGLGGVNSHTARIFFNALTEVGNYTITIGSAVRDVAGNSFDQDGTAGSNDTFTASFQYRKADVTVTAGSLAQNAAFFGEGVFANWTVQNIDPGAIATGLWSDTFFLSTDNMLDAGDFQLNSVLAGAFSPLGPGSSYATGSTVIAPVDPSLSDGVYFILIKTDGGNVLVENDETNNYLSLGQITLTTKPGPAVASMDPGAGSVFNGELNHIDLTFDTAINASTYNNSDFTVTGPDGAIVVTGFQAISADTVRVFFNTQSKNGSYTITAGPDIKDMLGNKMDQDDDGINGEASQDVFTGSFTIGLPDLTVDSATPGSFSAVFTNTLQVSWVVHNIGTRDTTGPWSDRLWLSADTALGAGDVQLKTVPATLTPLIAGSGTYLATTTVTLPLNPSLLAGDYFVLVQTDPFAQLLESDEANNIAASAAVNIALPPLPDLTVSAIEQVVEADIDPDTPGDQPGPKIASAGSQVAVKWTTTNNGGTHITNGQWSESIYLSTDGAIGGDILLGAFNFTTSLAVGGSVIRQQTVTLPTTIDGNVKFVVKVDSNSTIFESDENNNENIGADSTLVPPSLTLTLPATVAEGLLNQVGTITRSGSTAAPLNVHLATFVGVTLDGDGNFVPNPDATELAFPAIVVIPAGQNSVNFNFNSLNDSIIDGTQAVFVEARADFDDNDVNNPGSVLTFDYQTVNVTDIDKPTVQLTVDDLTLAEGESTTGHVSLNFTPLIDISVSLLMDTPMQLFMPPTVTILAGATSADFTITAIQDSVLEQPVKPVTLFAQATGFNSSSRVFSITDDDADSLQFTVIPSAFSEGAGSAAATGTIKRLGNLDNSLTINLYSSDPTEATVPQKVVIPAGSSTVTFTIAAIDDFILDGDQPAVLTARFTDPFTLQELTAGQTAANIVVTDNDGPTLTITLDRNLMGESGTATGKIRRTNGDNSLPLIIALQSSDVGEATVPPTVTINANESEATFTVTGIDDGVIDFSQPVTILGTAAGYASGAAGITVTDTLLPDLRPVEITVDPASFTNSTFHAGYKILNQGIVSASGAWNERVFLSTDEIFDASKDLLVGQIGFNGSVAAGAFYSRTITINTPSALGNYRLFVQVDPSNTLTEVLENNNVGSSAGKIQINPAYTATITATPEQAIAGSPITFSGIATRSDNAQPAQFEAVAIHILHNGTIRTIAAITNQFGQFTTQFNPLNGEGGDYSVRAGHPSVAVGDLADQDTFKIIGMTADPGFKQNTIIVGTPTGGSFTVGNLSNVALTGLTYQMLDVPANLTIDVTAPDTLAGDGSITVNYTINAADASVTSQLSRIRIQSAEGAMLELGLGNIVKPLAPHLTTSGAVKGGMVRGQQATWSVTVTNDGGFETGDLQIQLPGAFPWLSVAGPTTIPSIAAGQSYTFQLLTSPPANLPLGPYTGNIVISNPGVGASVPIQFNCVSEAKGDVLITTVDEKTFYGEGNPNLAGAHVVIRDAFFGDVVAEGITGADGKLLLSNLAEGVYNIEIDAVKHDGYRNVVQIIPGQTTEVLAFLRTQLVTYNWKVEPILIEDRYSIQLETVFTTTVPTPVVTVDPGLIDLSTVVGDETTINLTITNHGLISATDLQLTFPTDPGWEFTPLVTNLGDLAAKSSMVVPVLIRRLTPAGGSADSAGYNTNTLAGSGVSNLASALGASGGSGPCSLQAGLVWTLVCGPFGVNYPVPIPIINVSGNCGGTPSGSGGGGGGLGWFGWGGGGGGFGGFGGGGAGGGGPTGIYYSPPPDCSCGPDFVPTTYKGEVGLSVSKALDPLKAAINKILGKLVLPPPFSLQLTDLVFKGSVSGELTTCCENGQKGLKAKGQVQGGVEAVIRLGISGGLPGFTLSDGTAVEAEGFAGIELKLAGNVSATLETDCFFRNPKLTVAGGISGDLSLMAEVKGKAALPGVGTGEVSGKIGIKGSLSASVQASTGGGSHVTASAGPIVFFAGLEGSVENEITHVKTTVGGEYSRELAPQVTIPDAGGGSVEGYSADAGLSGDPTAGDIAAMFGYDSVAQLLVDCGCDSHDSQLFNNVTNQSTAKTLSDAIAAANKSSFVVVDAKPNTFASHVMSDVEAENRRLQSRNLASSGASGLAGDDGTCAQVRILIEQEAVLTRRAAGATLEITNNDDANPVTDIIVNPIIYDADGNVANDKFVLLPVVVTNMASHPGAPPAGWDEEVDGPYFTVDSFSLGAGQTGTVRFVFLPKDDAVPIGQASAVYRFGGTLTYTVGGVTTSNTLQPGTITVFPDAKLDLRYFLQRDVFSDDPFTDQLEPSIPFSLGVMVNNKGRGAAQNFKITSAQPKIIENEKGLLIDFQIIAAIVDGQNLVPSLEVNFGDIDPGETDVAQWLMKATLQGHFIEYKASFTHSDSLGGKAASLLDQIEIHETTHVVEAGGIFDDGKHDFLTNDLFDEEYLPDHLYLSDFSIAEVHAQDAVRGGAIITVGPQITTGNLQSTAQATLVDGWNYLRFLDPGHGQFKLISVQRSDGLFINLDENAWQTDRTFKEVDKRPIGEDVLHILDYNAPAPGAGGSDIAPFTYTLNFAPIDSDAPQIVTLQQPASPLFAPVDHLDVTFSELIDLAGFTEADVTLTRNGGPNLIALNPGTISITHQGGNVYRIGGLSTLTADDGAYSLTVNAAGVTDLFANAGVGSAVSDWSKAQFAPVIESIFGAPSAQTNQPAGDVFVKFSESVNLGSFDFNDLSLTRNGGVNLINNTVQITQVDSVTYRIQGLGPLTGAQGNYVLTVIAAGVEDMEGTSGVGSASVAWSVDTTPPALNNVTGAPPPVTASDPGDLFFNFSEPLDPSSFTLSDITLTLNGGGNIVNNTVTLQNINGSQFKLSNLAGLATVDGNYVLTINVAGVSDPAGNSGVGATVINWTRDSQAPAAATDLAVSPDTGVSNSDGITKNLTVTIGGQLGEAGLALFFKDVLHNVDLGSMQVAGTTFAKQVTLPVSGSQTVQIRAVDQAGNETATTIDFFVDVQPPVVNGFVGVPTSPTTQPVLSLDIVLSEAPVAGTFTKSNITLTRDNTALDLSGATLAQVPGNPLRFTLGNLASLTGDLGAYALTVDMTGVQDTAGNSGSSSTTAEWTLAISNADPNIFLTTSDYEVFEGETFFLNGFVIDDNGPWSGTVDFGCGCGIKTLIFSNADFSQTKIFRDNKPGDAAYLGVATILDSLGGTSNANFQVVVHNAAPVIVTFTADDLAGDIGQAFHFLGKATDAANTAAYTTDPLTYTFDFGDGNMSVVANDTPGQEVDFTAAASHVYTAAGHYIVKMTVDDGDGGVVFTTAEIDVAAPAAVANRAVFYNNSLFDGNGSALGAADDNAIATDKQALIAGAAAFENYTSYSRGINGIIVDINGLSGMPDASDFVFRVGNDSDPNGAGWSTLAVAPTILVRHGAGVGGSDRVMIGLPDNVVQKQWLQITVKASAHTGLGADDVFYFGNAIGETGNDPGNAIVDASDESGAATHPRKANNLAPIDFDFDFNRDGLVNAADQVIARVNKTTALTALQIINAPAPQPPQAPLGQPSGSSLDSNPLFSPADIDLLTGALNVDKKKLAVSNTWYNLLKKSAPLTENNGIVNLL